MKIDILTLFPEMFAPLQTSILGKAVENGLIEINYINIRDFSHEKHKKRSLFRLPFSRLTG